MSPLFRPFLFSAVVLLSLGASVLFSPSRTAAQVAGCYEFARFLAYGNALNDAADVQALHGMLLGESFLLEASAVEPTFTEDTADALRAFQKKYNLEQTGFADANTRRLLTEQSVCGEGDGATGGGLNWVKKDGIWVMQLLDEAGKVFHEIPLPPRTELPYEADEITRLILVENKGDAVTLFVNGATDAVGVKKGEEAEVVWKGDEAIISCHGSWDPTEKLLPFGTTRVSVNENGIFTLSCLDADGAAVTKSVIVSAVNPLTVFERVRKFFAPSSGGSGTPPTAHIGDSENTSEAQVLTSQIVNLLSGSRAELLSNGAPDPVLAALLRERKEAMLLLARTDPAAFLATVVPKDARSRVPQSLQSDIEEETTLEGTLEVYHSDDFNRPENSRFYYFLKLAGSGSSGKVALKSAIPKTERIEFYPAGDFAAVSGTRIGFKSAVRLQNAAVADTSSGNMAVGALPELDSVGEQRLLVLLLNFTDSSPKPFTGEEARNIFLSGQTSALFAEASYGRVSFGGDVFGWIELPRPINECKSLPSLDDPTIERFLRERSVSIENYGRLVMAINATCPDFGGRSSVGKVPLTFGGRTYALSQAIVAEASDFHSSGRQPFEWSRLDYILTHELGHSFGLPHANGWDCGRNALHGDCRVVAYGNLFDPMGGDYGSALHFNASYKRMLGWLADNRVLFIKTAGRYTLGPLEGESGPALAIVENPITSLPYFGLEYRRASGFDRRLNEAGMLSNQQGLLINAIKYLNGVPTARLIDARPTDALWETDAREASLNTGQRFSDPDSGVHIVPVEVIPAGAVFDIAFTSTKCIRRPPRVEHASAPEQVGVGERVPLMLQVLNTDSPVCAPALFTYAAFGVPADWRYQMKWYNNQGVQDQSSNEIAPDTLSFFSMAIDIPETAKPGLVEFSISIKPQGSILPQSKKFALQVLPRFQVLSASPPQGGVGEVIDIIGQGFKTDTPVNIGFLGESHLYAFITTRAISETRARFAVPSVLLKPCASGLCEVPTPPGVYNLQISSGASSATLPFIVVSPPSSGVSSRASNASSTRPFIRLSRAPASEIFQPQVLPIGRTPAALGSFDIVSSEAARLSPPVFRLSSTGSGAGLRGASSFELWQLDPTAAISRGNLSGGEDGIVFRDSVELRQGTSTFVIIASPIDRFVHGQRLTLSANFYKDDVEAISKAEPKRFLNFPKNEVIINTLIVVRPPEGENAPAQANMPADTLRAPERKETTAKTGKILVLPVDFLNSKARPYTREQLHSLVFEGPAQKFFTEQSYGRFVLDGDTSDWTTLQRNGALNTSCGAVTDTDIGEVVSARTINLAPYSTVLLFVTNALSEDCGGESSSHAINGRTYTFARALVSVSPDVHPAGYFPQPFPWSKYDFGVSHELGHALGANHANGLDCGAEQTSGQCILREYQNYFDVMGAGKYGLHFNAALKERLGWFAPDEALVVNQSGRYTLSPFETREGAKVAKIGVPGSATGEYVYAEYRTGAGFDAKMTEPNGNAPGLFINVVRKGPQGDFAPYLVDVNSSALSWDEDVRDAALTLGGARDTFSDPTRGITIGPAVSQEADRITFDVKIETPECVRGVPALIKNFINPNFVFPDKASLTAGESGVISMGFSNTDYPVCGASQFKVIPILPASWSYTMSLGEWPFTAWDASKEITINPGDADYKSIRFSVPSTATLGIYPVKYKVTHTTSGIETEQEFKVTVRSSAPLPPREELPVDDNELPAGELNLAAATPTITGSSAGAGKLYAGTMTFRAVVESSGGEIPETFKNSLQYRDVAVNGTWTDWVKLDVPPLSSGQYAILTNTWEGGAGEWEFRLVADSTNVIAESDEEDNFSESVRVSIVPRPGAAILPPPPTSGTPTLRFSTPVVSGRQAGFGKLVAGTMTIQAKVTNIGNGVTPPFQLLFLYSQDGQHWNDWVRVDSPRLAPEAEQTATYSWEGGTGGWYIKACEDIKDTCSPPVFFEVVSG